MKIILGKSGLTPLEKTTDFNRRSSLIEADGHLKRLSSQAAREGNSLTGLTIVELLVATLIGALTFLVLFYVSFTIQDSINISSGILGITETGRFAVNRISNDIREAGAVKPSYSSYTSGNAALVLEIPVANVSGTVTGHDIIIYTLDAGDPTKLRRIVYAAAGSVRRDISEIIAGDVKNLLFSSGEAALSSVTDKNAVNILTVKIIVAKPIMGLERPNEVTTSAALRNKKIGL